MAADLLGDEQSVGACKCVQRQLLNCLCTERWCELPDSLRNLARGLFAHVAQRNLPTTLDELYRFNDVELYDLHTDPHEMTNLAATKWR